MSATLSMTELPTSFGGFNPIGWLMVGQPTQAIADALVPALEAAGWPSDELLRFAPSETLPELEALLEQAGPPAGSGDEATLLSRYVQLTRQGYRWLLVKAGNLAQAAAAARVARGCGATLAVHYRRLMTEELI